MDASLKGKLERSFFKFKPWLFPGWVGGLAIIGIVFRLVLAQENKGGTHNASQVRTILAGCCAAALLTALADGVRVEFRPVTENTVIDLTGTISIGISESELSKAPNFAQGGTFDWTDRQQELHDYSRIPPCWRAM